VRELTLNGLIIEVFVSKVIIYDPFGDVSNEEVVKIIQYLYSEGFVDKKTISCDILKRRK
jgi:hypothetical protein